LKRTALAYAQATLTGSVAEIRATLDPYCNATDHLNSAALPLVRQEWGSQDGTPLNQVRIIGVRVRNVTTTSGQADVEYKEDEGNANWVTYTKVKGQWKVAGQCVVPFGNWRYNN
jgi:hypothetical protein